MKKELYDLTIREFILAFLPHSKEWYEDGNKDYYYLVSESKLAIFLSFRNIPSPEHMHVLQYNIMFHSIY